MLTWTDFNINNAIRIKITDVGWATLRAQDREDIKVDAEGWSEWQMWDAIATFGPAMIFGSPFETTIQISHKILER